MFRTGIIQEHPCVHVPIATSQNSRVPLFGNSITDFKKSWNYTCSVPIKGCTLHYSITKLMDEWLLPCPGSTLLGLKDSNHLFDMFGNREYNKISISRQSDKLSLQWKDCLSQYPCITSYYHQLSNTCLQDLTAFDCSIHVTFLHQLATTSVGCSSFSRNGTTGKSFRGSSEIPKGTFVHKVLRHGHQLLRRKMERNANESCNGLFLTVNLRYVQFPGTVKNSYLRLLLGREQSDFLDQGDGGNIWGGSGNGKARIGEEGAGDENSFPAQRKSYLLWGLCISIAWILFRCLALHYAVAEPITTSIGQYAVGALWLGLVWCLLTFVLWTTELPLQLLCRYSPEYLRDRVPLVLDIGGLRLHESMARNFGVVPTFALSWFFVSDLISSLKQVVRCQNMQCWSFRCQSGDQSERKKSCGFLSARKRASPARRPRRRQRPVLNP